MAIGTIKSVGVTNFETLPTEFNQVGNTHGLLVDTIEIPTTATDDVGDIILFGPISKNAKVKSVKIFNDALAASGLAFDIGIYKADGTVKDADFFGSAVVKAVVDRVGTEVAFESGVNPIESIGSTLKTLLADTDAHGNGVYYIGLTVTTVATTPAAGTMTLVVEQL